MSTLTTVKPIFLKQKNIPHADKDRPTVLEICLAAERVTGQGSIIGAQDIQGLWRIYPVTQVARSDILVKGMSIRDTLVQVSSDNPFLFRDDTGQEKPSTKLWISNIPLSVADTEIEYSLTKLGCELRSAVKLERARDTDNRLTRFLTGRRFVFITVPSTPLDKTLKINVFTAQVYHKEQKLGKKKVQCSRCLELNHHVSECDRDVVCRDCRQEGHKRGDPACTFTDTAPGNLSVQQQQDEEGEQSVIPTLESAATPKRPEIRADNKAGELSELSELSGKSNMSRPMSRQSTLFFEQISRSRSETPKRHRSKDSPVERSEKVRRRGNRRENRSPQSPSSGDKDCVRKPEHMTADDWR